MFLTLVCERFALATKQNRAIALPENDKVFNPFVEQFGDTQSLGSFNSRFRRKDGSRLNQLKVLLDPKKGDLRPTGGPEYQLTIAEGELEAYIEDGHVSLEFDTNKDQDWEEGKAESVGTDQEVQGLQTIQKLAPQSPDAHTPAHKTHSQEPEAESSPNRNGRAGNTILAYSPTAARN